MEIPHVNMIVFGGFALSKECEIFANIISRKGKANVSEAPCGDSFTKYVLRSKIQESAPKMRLNIDDKEINIPINNQDQSKHIIRDAEWSMNYKWRGPLWLELCRHLNKESFLTKNIYDDCCKQLHDNGRNASVATFVDRRHVYSYNLSEEGCNVCNKVLNIISSNHPAITYAPTLYSMCTMLAHYIYDESDLYSCIDSLVTGQKGKLVLQTKLRFDASIGTIIQLIKRHSRASYLYMKKLVKDADGMKLLFRNWIWWIFRDLPFSYLVRVMDCYLCEGMKMLYRAGMAIIILFHKYSGRYSESISSALKKMDINSAISEFVSTLPKTEEKYMKVAFNIRNLKSVEVSMLELEREMIAKSENIHSTSSNSNKSLNMTYPHVGTGHSPVTASNSILSFEMASSTLTVKETNDHQRPKSHSIGALLLPKFSSSLISSAQLVSIWSWLPPRITTMQPQVIYSTNEHGSSLISFFMMAEKYEPTILVIKTSNKEVIGAYCSGSWLERHELDEAGNKKMYFATGESFLFTLAPKIHKFPWIGIKNPDSVSHSSHLFMMATDIGIAIGGGGSHGLWLDKELAMGRTGHCDTFDNPSLISAAHDDFSDASSTDFTCLVLEVIGFTPT